MRIVSVDPGLSGGIALHQPRQRVRVYPVPILQVNHKRAYDLYAVRDLILSLNPDLIVVESVTRPAQLTRFMGFVMGIGYGANIDVATIRPQVWRKQVGLQDGERKDASIRLALELWPYLGDDIKRKTDDGKAEAALLGRAYMEMMK